jgi:PDZ domain
MSRKNTRWILAGLAAGLAMCAVGARAQSGAEAQTSHEMKRLAFMVGKWTKRGKSYPLGRAPLEYTGTREVTWTLQGNYLQIRDTLQYTGLPLFEILHLVTYDPQAKLFRDWSFSSRYAWPSEASGRFEQEKLVFTSQENPATSGGIGVSVDPMPTKEGYARIVSVRPGGPAAKAGITPGVMITKVDDTPITSGAATGPLIRGQVGTSVHVNVRSGEREREVTLPRESDYLPLRQILEPKSKTEYVLRNEVEEEGRVRTSNEVTFTAAR